MQTLARIIGSAAVAVAAVALTACGGNDNNSASPSTTAPGTHAPAATSAAAAPTASHGRECTADDIGVTGGFGQAPTITIPDNCDPPKQLVTKDLVEGTGPAAASGRPVEMNYSLVTWSDKKKLDSSFDRGQTFPLTLGTGEVIPGWDQGLIGIKQGGRRLLIIPPDLGYGQGGQGVKPNETLVFVTDAVKVG
ncbi:MULTISPECIES: FKBP-type peptidyl-prolyl cis-trans isomerase [Nocardia]|jgi:peptidylprolyl isomerase|uniref:FKBP-type peptidyl-prolyl cis-trans isomerase n=1 Tax=Nocardia TaxID=1817 RepID=UPI0007A46972|nr:MULTISPECIES: FKBP-type peptidyl-prolyl cis-trans isomerase [Nocardia]MBF6273580.1 FKBP-type peptidyl-prolyl cis-trans isomerase [Nocardia nova]OBA53552.1 peptidylprolyl isomerase [Nocardia sp. 852002-51101_SCH5132738]OBF76316.1 peptidylprolyl isomerase [Mycobacterium sp. 852002-51759_SCH5129042]PPJ05334.1 peptidylprolyl isomerase [Nocardia nova]